MKRSVAASVCTLFALIPVLVFSGCARAVTVANTPPPPAVFQTAPDLASVIAAVNRTDAVRELSTNSATVDVLSMKAVPKLSANMHLQRNRNFRLKASVPLIMGTGIDLGSNDNEFWFEVPEGMTQTLYFANHQQYASQLDRAILPVDPSWMIEAIGLAHIDPATVLAGPVTRTDGMIEIRTAMTTPAGTYQRVCFIEPQAGYITHQFLYSPQQKLVAKSFASEHQYYDSVDSVLPHRVKMELFPNNGPALALQLDVASYSVNQLLSGDPQLFAIPSTANRVDLLQISGLASSTVPPSTFSQPTGSAWSQPTTTAAGVPATYSASTPTGPPMRGIRYE